MPDTWRYWSKQVYGYVATMTAENEYTVSLYKIQNHLNEGHTPAKVALIWNQGHAGECKAGTNSKGVAYNSCAYQQKVLAMMR